MPVRHGGRARSAAKLTAAVLSLLMVMATATVLTGVSPAAADDPPPAPRIVTTSGNHSCATVADGTVRCWGFDAYGQTDVPADLGPVIDLSVGGFHSCAVKADGTAQCWGGGSDFGQATVPADLGTVTSIEGGNRLSCAIKTDGTPRCWGWFGSYNELALPADIGTVTEISVHYNHACAIKTGGLPVCWGGNEYGKATVPGDLGTVISISAGEDHSCAVKTDGTPVCWGGDSAGQATVPGDAPPATAIAAGRSTCMLATDGTLRCWGDNYYGQATPPAGTFQSLSSFFVGVCAVSTANEIACWGPTITMGSSPDTPAPAPPAATAGQPYSHTFTSSRGLPVADFAVTSGSLPPGLTLSPAGVLSGTPSTGGDYSFTVTAAGEVFPVASAPFVLHVDVPVVPPQNVEPARIAGFTDRPRVGRTLTAKPGTWTPAGATFSYRWFSSTDGSLWDLITGDDGQPLTTAKYRPAMDDLGLFLRAEVTATNPDGSSSVTVDTPTTVGSALGTATNPREPEAVTQLSATGWLDGTNLEGNMEVTWKPSLNNGRVVDRVRIQVEVLPNGTVDTEEIAVLSTAPQPRFTRVRCPGEVGCRITVTSRNAIGWGEPAETIGLFRVPASPTVGSTSVVKTQVGQISTRLTVPTDQGGLPITGYRYDVSTDGGPFEGPYDLSVTPVSGGRQVVANPVCSTDAQFGCSFRYYAVNPVGTSAPTTKDSNIEWNPPGPVSFSLAKSATPGVLNATITPPKILNGLPVLGYEYQVDVDSGSASASGTLPPDATSASIPCPGVTALCKVSIIAFNLTGPGPYADNFKSVTFNGNGQWVPTSPMIVENAVDPVAGVTDLTVEWSEPNAPTNIRNSLQYELQVCALFTSDCEIVAPPVVPAPGSGNRRQAVVPCPAGVSCTVQVRSASAAAGFSFWTAKDFDPTGLPDEWAIPANLDTTLVPLAPQGVSVTDVGGGDVEVSWVTTYAPPCDVEENQGVCATYDVPLADRGLFGWTVLACDAATGCDDDVDWVVAAAQLAPSERSAVHTCGFDTTCRYVVVSQEGPGQNWRYGHLSEAVSITTASEEPTFNDDLVDAIELTGMAGSIAGSNVGATNTSPFEPATCIDCNGEYNDGPNKTVWYTWTAPEDGVWLFATCGATNFDTMLAVFTGSQIDALTRVVNDDQGCGDQSVVGFEATAGVTYSIQVDGFDGDDGSFTLSWMPDVEA